MNKIVIIVGLITIPLWVGNGFCLANDNSACSVTLNAESYFFIGISKNELQEQNVIASSKSCFFKGCFKRVVTNDIPFEEQIKRKNATYVIKYDFDLHGKEITIPNNCTLKFEGGSISNGTIIGQDTRIVYNEPILSDVNIAGTWNVPVIYSWMFKDIEKEDKIRLLFDLCSSNIQNDVYIDKLDSPYVLVPRGNAWYSSTGISLPSFTSIHNKGTIQIKPNGCWRYCIFAIDASSNILIEGGEYVGDKNEHDYSDQSHSTHEWGYAIWSYRGSKSITIRNVHFHDFTGDAIELNSKDAIIENVIIHDNRRQGISVCDCSFVKISNFEIYNIGLSAFITSLSDGTDPRSAIDVEPNILDAHDIIIENGFIYNCHRGLVCSSSSHSIYNNTYRNIKIENVVRPIRHYAATDCIYDGILISGTDGEQEKGSTVNSACLFYGTNNIQIVNSSIKMNGESNAYAFYISSGEEGCTIKNSYIEAKSPFSVKNTTITDCVIICSSGVSGELIKNSKIQVERRNPVAATLLSASLDNCDVYIDNHLLVYDVTVSNCKFFIEKKQANAVFILAANSNPIFYNSTITALSKNSLFSNTVSGSSLNVVKCKFDLAPGCSYGSNLNGVFLRSEDNENTKNKKQTE